jgi:four helix bundle protein
MDLAVAVYAAIKFWPKEELYGLTSQVRRAATSVPSNIAEGYAEKFAAPTNSSQDRSRIVEGTGDTTDDR